MTLKEFIKKLKKISSEHGENMEVVMADNILVVEPVFLNEYHGGKVIITDQNEDFEETKMPSPFDVF